MDTFGRRLAARRKRLKLTQRQLGLDLNIDPLRISRWERGVATPRGIEVVSQLARALGVTVGWLIGEEAT